jgi:hypothetical protein
MTQTERQDNDQSREPSDKSARPFKARARQGGPQNDEKILAELPFSDHQQRLAAWIIIFLCGCVCVTLLAFWIAAFVLTMDKELFKQHYVGVVGMPSICLGAFMLVMIFRRTSGPIQLEMFSIKFKGAAGPIIMWALAVLTMATAVKMNW